MVLLKILLDAARKQKQDAWTRGGRVAAANSPNASGFDSPKDATCSAPLPAYAGRRANPKDRLQAKLQHNPVSGLVGNYSGCFLMTCNTDKRRRGSLPLTLGIANSLCIVGLVFVILAATGTFPVSVETQKYVGVYADNITKYSLYLLAGILGVVAIWVANRKLERRETLSLPRFVTSVAILTLLASLGLGCYLIERNSELNAPTWSYLIYGLMIVQRLLYLWVASMAWHTMSEADKDPAVYAVVAGESLGEGSDVASKNPTMV